MFIGFVAALVLVIFAFRILLALVGIPITLLIGIVEGGRENPHGPLSTVLSQALLAAAFAGLVAVFAAVFMQNTGAGPSWLYGATGFLATYLVLGGNAMSKRQEFGSSWAPEAVAVVRGAELGVLVGPLVFIPFFLFPQLLLLIPGFVDFYSLVFSFASWLSAFWLVRVILLFTVGGYILNAGFVILFAGVLAVTTLWNGARRLAGVGAREAGP